MSNTKAILIITSIALILTVYILQYNKVKIELILNYIHLVLEVQIPILSSAFYLSMCQTTFVPGVCNYLHLIYFTYSKSVRIILYGNKGISDLTRQITEQEGKRFQLNFCRELEREKKD